MVNASSTSIRWKWFPVFPENSLDTIMYCRNVRLVCMRLLPAEPRASLTSLGSYAWAENESTIFSHLFVGGKASFSLAGGVNVALKSNYPWDGNLTYTFEPKEESAAFTFAVRIPGWCKEYTLRVNGQKVDTSSLLSDGYVYLNRSWKSGDTVYLALEMPVEKIYANTAVRADAGCVALMRGPLVYAFESVDNGDQLQALRIPRASGRYSTAV